MTLRWLLSRHGLDLGKIRSHFFAREHFYRHVPNGPVRLLQGILAKNLSHGENAYPID